MKTCVSILFILVSSFALAQRPSFDFSEIDRRASQIEANSPDTLAYLLTHIYQNDIEKVRAIFRWITEHISYRVPGRRNKKNASSEAFVPEETDTTFELQLVNETIARKVLKKRNAVCDGYTRLFKTLCDYALVRSEIVTGYAKGNIDPDHFGNRNLNRPGNRFRSNHSWNAVYLDSNWRLLDVTWASGHTTYFSEEFVKQYNDYYFFTPPELFIKDHYPEDLYWTLLPNPPILKEYSQTPFKLKSFLKYSIVSYKPSQGIIDASVGDTILLELQVADIWRDKGIASDPFFDSSILTRSPTWAFLQPESETFNRKIRYKYAVESDRMEWLHIMYNQDLIMRYKLNIRKDQPTTR